jgi:hypothetical protein
LQHSDRRILRHLLAQASEVDDVMHPHSVRMPRSVGIAFALLGVGLLTVALYFSGEEEFAASVLEKLESGRRRLRLFVSQTTVTQWLGFVTVLVVLFGFSLTVGTRKS